MLQIDRIAKSYGTRVLFEDVSFTIAPAERIGLVGRNGHGKTTLFRLILGEEQPDSGSISIPQGYAIGHLSQHLRFSQDTVLSEGCLGLKDHEDGVDESYRVKAILMGLGFSEADFLRRPDELSGGYQIRLNLAKLLASGPNLLLLDEPTNYLDILSIRWLARFLRNWKNELVIITHDRSFMDSVTTHTMGIHRGRLRKVSGTTEKFYSQLALEEEHYEKARLNDERKQREAETFIRRFRAQANRARAVQSRIKALNRMQVRERLSDIKGLDFSFRHEEFHGKWLIDAKDVRFSFSQDSTPLIDRFTLTISKADRIAVIGKNGKGKTTLLGLLSGELAPSAGTVTRNPQMAPASFGQTNIERLRSDSTVEEEILDIMPEHDRRVARGICGLMMFEGDDALKKVQVLSGGEKSRVLLGKLLVRPANILFLDEPTNHLDMDSTEALLEALEAFEGAVVIVTHNEMILHSFPERLVVFDNGISVFEGPYRDFLDRVGWSDEAEKSSFPEKKGSRTAAQHQRKDLKRVRAGIIDSRAKVIGALQRRAAEIENTIMKAEQEIAANTEAILKDSEKGEWQSASALSQANRAAQEKIDRLFQELAALEEEIGSKSREFEEQLKRLA
ncbi:MAG: ABC-F family ATP-binding cassette domain-containing protein [Thermodesulfovibrionales bacterium]